jgi:hypothetical protein
VGGSEIGVCDSIPEIPNTEVSLVGMPEKLKDGKFALKYSPLLSRKLELLSLIVNRNT